MFTVFIYKEIKINMGQSKKWLALTPEERAVKMKVYRATYAEKHPERIVESEQKYREKHRDRIRIEKSTWQKDNGRSNKLKGIEYLGGKCADCGGEFPPYIYDFHHIDPSVKEHTITRIMGRNWEGIKPELDKCVLLCAHCHRTRHFNLN